MSKRFITVKRKQVSQITLVSAVPILDLSQIQVVYCCWCFTSRALPYNPKKRCCACNRYGATTFEESRIRNVYVQTYQEAAKC